MSSSSAQTTVAWRRSSNPFIEFIKPVRGVLFLLLAMYGILFAFRFEYASQWSNIKDVLSQQAFFGVITLGAGLLILTGGIDLSIGSVVGLSAVGFGVLMRNGVSPTASLGLVLLGGIVIGTTHGLLVTRLKLQPFLVTLCGLFVYRGIARILSPSKRVGIEQVTQKEHPEFAPEMESIRGWLVGKDLESALGFPMQLVVMLVLALILGVLLHGSIYGRYWYAMGHNEQAARYAGINTNRQRIVVYILCSLLAALGGILTFLDYGSATPETTGESWELYAITGAVLGGCSLRGGVGTIQGMVLGAAVLPLLKNLISFIGTIEIVLKYVPNVDTVIPVVIGLTLLFGTIADEYFRRGSKGRS